MGLEVSERVSRFVDEITSHCARCDKEALTRLTVRAFTPMEAEIHRQYERAERAEVHTAQLLEKLRKLQRKERLAS